MGSAWKNLPEELSGPARLLAEELRVIKDAAGLSLSELAARTHYSRASWERWLNGKRVITGQALEALTGAVDCDGPALRTLWERAVAGPEEGGGPAAPEEPAAQAVPEQPRAAQTPTAQPPTDRTGAPATPAAAAPPAASDVTDVTDLLDLTAAPGEPGGAGPAPVPWWRRPATLLAGAALLAALLVLVGLRATRHQEQPQTVAEPVPTATTAKPAPGAPVCQAVGCAHKDPKATGCGKDARTLQTDVIGKVVVYLRYSQTCQAAWAAITEGEPNDYATISDDSGQSETALIHWGYDNYSSMLDAADPAVTFQVCGYQPAGHVCTSPVSGLAAVVASTPIPIGPASPPPGTGPDAAATDPPSPAQPTDAQPASAQPAGAQPSPGRS
ncbi:DUF2690 domain-containing protein [Kitasatospora sp. NPDC057940]|uniref:helix-turn-helix domain-containing protein n=1 Tax=Kitasatospora sp. NPDC057940 TaxID=3346285 RepID=UPI0036DE99C8